MTAVLLFSLFFVLFFAPVLGIDTSLAPGLSVKNLFLYLIFAAIAIDTVVTRRRKPELLSVFVPFGLYVAYAIFSWLVVVLVVGYPNYSLFTSLVQLKSGAVEHLMVLLVFFYGTTDLRRAIWVLKGMVLLVIVGNVITVIDGLHIVDFGLIAQSEDGRTGGVVGQANQFGALLALFLPAIVAMYLTQKGVRKLLVGLGLLCSVLAFFLALSRGAFVGLAVAGLFGAYYLRAQIPLRVVVNAAAATVIACGATVAIMFAAGYGHLIIDRFALMASGNEDAASSGRTGIWARAIATMLEDPITFLTGFGWYAYQSFRKFYLLTHNTYLLTLFNLGAIGLSLFVLSAGNALRAARAAIEHASEEARPFLFAFIFGFLALLGSIFFGELFTPWLYVWAFVGVSLRVAVSSQGIEHGLAALKVPRSKPSRELSAIAGSGKRLASNQARGRHLP